MQPISASRRKFLKAAGVLGMATAGNGMGVRRADAQQVPYSTGTKLPKLKAPANACDCHMHIYDAKYPIAPSATMNLQTRRSPIINCYKGE
jgi:D-galactarolactone isomerase